VPDFEKGNSPFSPNQPVSPDFFVGRSAEIDHIVERGVRQAARGKPTAMFLEGEFGIGKTSLARLAQHIAETRYDVHAIYCSVGGVKNLDDLGAAILQATLRSGALDPSKTNKLRDWISKFGEQKLFGISFNLPAIRTEAPQLSTPYGLLDFLGAIRERLESSAVFLVLDELNGIADNPDFAHFIKGLIDSNAVSKKTVPLMLMLCGIEERRREMIRNHQPVERIFDVVEVEPMAEEDARQFFETTFTSVNVGVAPFALSSLAYHSSGFPKIMQMLGDAAFWLDDDNFISPEDAAKALLAAAEDVGKKYVDQQVYKALRSADYRSILDKVGCFSPAKMMFTKAEITEDLTATERKKLNNFLQKMKHLNVLRSGENQGEYEFTQRMVRLYIWLRATQEKKSA
jgi:AAA ATPase domain